MTTAPTTAPAQGTEEIQDAGHVDVLIVGAGVSGIGAAHHLREQFPGRTFVILDAQDNRGGTWWTHQYPGVRSDSDLFTYGYRFKPWRGPAIAAGEEILAYLDEVIDEDDLGQHIRYQHRVTAASWSTADRRWTVEVTRGDTGQRLRYTAGFLWMCQGYYNHAKPYRPRWEGMDRFQGVIVHPQQWPRGPRPDRQARRRHRLRRHGRDADPRDRGEGGARDDAAALALLLLRPANRRTSSPWQLRALDVPEEWTHEILRRKFMAQTHLLARMSAESPARAARAPHRVDAPAAARRASTSTSTSRRATARGSSASPSSPTVTCSRRCARARRRSSPTPSRRSPSAGSRSARARRSRPTSWSAPPGSTCRCSATSRSPSTASRSTSPGTSPGAAS